MQSNIKYNIKVTEEEQSQRNRILRFPVYFLCRETFTLSIPIILLLTLITAIKTLTPFLLDYFFLSLADLK